MKMYEPRSLRAGLAYSWLMLLFPIGTPPRHSLGRRMVVMKFEIVCEYVSNIRIRTFAGHAKAFFTWSKADGDKVLNS